MKRNVEADDFLDKVSNYLSYIVRNTYYKFKEKLMSVNEIGNMDDMKKLKSANTSTR